MPVLPMVLRAMATLRLWGKILRKGWGTVIKVDGWIKGVFEKSDHLISTMIRIMSDPVVKKTLPQVSRKKIDATSHGAE